MPPLNTAPEAAAILVATLAIGNRVVEHHVETQQLPRGIVAVREAAVLRRRADVAFPEDGVAMMNLQSVE